MAREGIKDRDFIMSSRLATILFLALASCLIAAGSSPAYARSMHAASPLGFWSTEDNEGVVELYACGKEVCGRLHWMKLDTSQSFPRDEKNPDASKRSRALCKMQFMGGFHRDEEGHFTDGWIYSPRHGQTFSAELTVIDKNTLDLHGYILTPILGESQTWKRTARPQSCQTQQQAKLETHP